MRRLVVLGCPAPRAWLSRSSEGFDCSRCAREVVDLSLLEEHAARRVLARRDAAGRGPCVAYRPRGRQGVALRTGLATFSVTYLAGCAPWSEGEEAQPPDEDVCRPEASGYDPALCERTDDTRAVVEAPPPVDKACDGPERTPDYEVRFVPYRPQRGVDAVEGAQGAAVSSIVGYVEDLYDEAPIPGARVVVSSPALAAPVKVRTDARGVFRVEPIPAGRYEVRVFTDWAQATRELALPAHQRAQLAFKIEDEEIWMGVMEEID